MSERFARLKRDPRFRRPKKHANKVEIDPRFKSLLEEKPGKGAAKVDKYGRKIAKSRENDGLSRFYRMPDTENGLASVDYARGEGLVESSSEEDEETSESDNDRVVVLGEDANRPISVLEEAAEIDLDESQFAALDAEAERNLARDQASGNDTATTTKPTKRLAVVNLDWDHVKASHLFKIFSSQLSSISAGATGKTQNTALSRGRLLHVRIYPSEFGKKKMAEEDKSGPPAELFLAKDANKDLASDDEYQQPNNGEEYDQTALRRYQLQRLRYYYAIATFDTPAAATHVYTELEGTELERSANLLDLSYVPEDMEFDEEPRDEATHDAISYQPLDFTTDALRHSNVKLTWDDDDPERVRITRRQLSKKEIDEMDFKALIASSDEEDEEEDRPDPEKLRALLLNGNDENLPEGWGGTSRDKAADMEITFTPGLSEQLKEADTKRKGDPSEYETTLERYQRKEKEKKKAKKAARDEARKEKSGGASSKALSKPSDLDDAFFGEDTDEGGLEEEEKPSQKGKKGKKADSSENKVPVSAATEAELSLLLDDENVKHFDMAKIVRAEKQAEKGEKKKKKRKRADKGDMGLDAVADNEVELDLSDPRFKSLREDHRFAIDPTNPHFKKTKTMKKLLQAKNKREEDEGRDGKRRKVDA